MNITKEQVAAIAGADSDGLIIINLNRKVGVEVCAASTGPVSIETMRILGDAAAKGIREAMHNIEGCACPKCVAGRAFSNNAPQAQA